MLDILQSLDKALLLFFNQTISNSFFDVVLPIIRNKNTWIPFYIAFAIYLLYQYHWKGLYFIAAIALTIAVTDQLSSSLLKPLFHRTRPCNDPDVLPLINSLIECGVGKSLPSSHASNHFALVFLIMFAFKELYQWIRNTLVVWAILICIGQVYVGVHYPLDVTSGALLGALIGYFIGRFFVYTFGYIEHSKAS